MQQGYIPLWRKFQDNELWREPREFSKAEAWLDILMEARWQEEPGQVAIGLKVFECRRGQVLYSASTWARRWGWSKWRVTRFFDMLKNRSMIATESLSVTQRLTVCNYDKYAISRNGSAPDAAPRAHRVRTDRAPTALTTKEGYKGKKGNNKEQKNNTFARPSIAVVMEYAKEQGLSMDCQAFYDYYESNGWKVGRNSMEDWRAAARNWARRDAAARGDGDQTGMRATI